MSAHKRLKFRLGEYILKSIERKFKKGFDEVCFRGDIARKRRACEGSI